MPPRRTWPKASSSPVARLGHAADRLGPLGDDDDRREAGLEPAADQLADLLEVEGLLRDQDHVGAAGEPGVEGDPAGVAAHHLDDQHPVVAVGGRVQAVDRLHRDVDRGVEAEGVVGGAEVVVDRLRHADDLDAVLVVEARRRAQRVLAADRDQPVDAGGLQVLGDPLRAAVLARTGWSARSRGSCRRGAGCRAPRAPRAGGCRPPAARASRRGSRRTRGRRRSTPLRTIARITAFSPGQSPPPVSTPIRIGSALGSSARRRDGVGSGTTRGGER